MADNLACDPKVSTPDCLFKIGDWGFFDENFDDYWNLNWEWGKSYNKMMSQSQDVLDMLPSDPFEMNISGGCAMIRGWIEEIGEGIEVEEEEDESGDDDDDDELFSGLNLVLTEARRICSGVGDVKIGGKSIEDESFDGGLFLLDGCDESCQGKVLNSSISSGDGNGDGGPSDGLFYALGYLGVRDLLSIERVCKSLRDGVRNDPLLWRSIHIDQPQGETFTDECLLRLTSRANGSLQSLSLVKCFKITDNGLKSVFKSNPGLTKLSVAGCVGLTVNGLLRNMNSLKSAGGPGIKFLRIGGLLGLTTDHFEELKHAISADNPTHLSHPTPRFYHGSQLHLPLDDNRPLDVEPCPKCHQLRQVYDCPSDTCRERRNRCRACTCCIARCINCGCCFNERDYMETFCLDFLCLDCLTQFLNFPDAAEEDMGVPVFTQQSRYRFCLYGQENKQR